MELPPESRPDSGLEMIINGRDNNNNNKQTNKQTTITYTIPEGCAFTSTLATEAAKERERGRGGGRDERRGADIMYSPDE